MKHREPKSLAEQSQELYDALVILRDEVVGPFVWALDWLVRLFRHSS